MIFNAGQRRGESGPKLPPKGQPLSQYTWAEIDQISQAGKAAEYFLVGDTRQILDGTASRTVEIIGFAHDDLADGSGKAGVTFCLQDTLSGKRAMNDTATNAGGWSESQIRAALLSNLFNRLEEGLRAVIKPVIKKTTAGSRSTTIVETVDRLFPPAEIEIFGTVGNNASAAEGTQYPFFATTESRIKKFDGTASVYWTRTPAMGNTANFRTVLSSGASATGTAANLSNAVTYAFCV